MLLTRLPQKNEIMEKKRRKNGLTMEVGARKAARIDGYPAIGRGDLLEKFARKYASISSKWDFEWDRTECKQLMRRGNGEN